MELPKNEQVKQPSASVKPDNQESLNVGVTKGESNSTTCARDRLLNASRNRVKLACFKGKTKFP